MRRPAPLPASADEPARGTAADHDGGRRGRRTPSPGEGFGAGFGAADRTNGAAPEAETDVIADDVVDAVSAAAAGSDAAGADTGTGSDTGSESDAAVRSSEVWRAARARRKALRAEIRRFTSRSRRRRNIWLGAVGAVVLLVLGSVVAAYSPLFAVREITVAGAETIDPALVEQALQGQIGSPLALVDAGEVKSALTEFPMIENYALEARPPHELVVRIVERTPIGVISSDAGFSLVDAAGVVLSTTPEQPAGQPRLDISGGIDSAAFRSAGLVMRSLPADLRATVTEVRASSGDDVSFTTSDGKTVIWGGEGDSVRKAEVLVRLIAATPDSRTFDVSSPTVPVAG